MGHDIDDQDKKSCRRRRVGFTLLAIAVLCGCGSWATNSAGMEVWFRMLSAVAFGTCFFGLVTLLLSPTQPGEPLMPPGPWTPWR